MMKRSILTQDSPFLIKCMSASCQVNVYSNVRRNWEINGAYHWNIRSITKTEIFTKYTLSFHGGQGFIFLLSSTSDIYLLQECRCRHFIREIKLSLLHYSVHHSKYSTEESQALNQLVAGNILKFGMITDKLVMRAQWTTSFLNLDCMG